MQSKESPRLRECPFCGAEPITRIRDFYTSMQKLTLTCSVGCPRCAMYQKVGIELCDTSFEKMEAAMHEAIEAWNRRAVDGNAD